MVCLSVCSLSRVLGGGRPGGPRKHMEGGILGLGGDVWGHMMHNMDRDTLTFSDILSLALTSKGMWRRVRDTIKWENVYTSELYGACLGTGFVATRRECWRRFVKCAKSAKCAVCWDTQARSVPASWLQYYNAPHNKCFSCFTRMHIKPAEAYFLERDTYTTRVVVVVGNRQGSAGPSHYLRIPDGTSIYLSNEVRQYYAECVGRAIGALGYGPVAGDDNVMGKISDRAITEIFKHTAQHKQEHITAEQLREMLRWASPLLYCATQSTDADQSVLDEMDWEN